MYEPRYARRAEAMRASEIRELLKLLEEPGIISFAGGIPDPALFPKDAASKAYTAILADPAKSSQALQYSVSEGFPALRQWIARYMGTLGVPATPDHILVTSGSQQALEFLGRLFITAGDTVLVTAPTYLGALQAFSAYEPRYDNLRPESGNRTPASYREAAMQAYYDVGFRGPIRPDHVATVSAFEANRFPGYNDLGALFAIGYIKGLMEAVVKT